MLHHHKFNQTFPDNLHKVVVIGGNPLYNEEKSVQGRKSMNIPWGILSLSPEMRAFAEDALALDPRPVKDENGAVDPTSALADILRRIPRMQEQYRARTIGDDVLAATLSDLSIWMNTCRRETGEWGLLEYDWLMNHVSLKLFRLGRLQFIHQPNTVPAHVYAHPSGELVVFAQDGARFNARGESDGTNGIRDKHAWTAYFRETDDACEGFSISYEGLAIHRSVKISLDEWQPLLNPGDPVLDVHIPEGEPLDPRACDHAFAIAPRFFQEHFNTEPINAFTCESWLLDWALPYIVPDSNLARFQRRFYCVPFEGSDHQMLERVFDKKASAPNATDTRLQRAITDWYQRGNRCRDAYGFIPTKARYARPVR